MVVLILPFVALYIAGIGLVALPIALGSRHWGIRLASLFGVSLLFGLTPAVVGIQSEITSGILLGVLLVAGGLSTSLDLFRFPMTAIGLVFLVVTFLIIPWQQVDLGLVVRGFASIGLVSASMLLLRILGYRLADLCPEQRTNDFLVGTGHDLETWCRLLDRRCDDDATRQDVVEVIRGEGMDFTWAETIADTYERYRGTRPLPSRIGDARMMSVDHKRGVPYWKGIGTTIAIQFSIRHLMSWSAILAAILAFTKIFADDFPSRSDLAFGIPLVLLLSLTTIASAIAALSMYRDGISIAVCAAIVLAATFAAPHLFQLPGLVAGPLNLVSIVMILTALAMFAGFSLVRQRGYRILCVQRDSVPTTCSPKASPIRPNA
jgi:hypothetical protein